MQKQPPNSNENKEQVEERRQTLLTQILEPEARARLTRLSLVKPEKSKGMEELLLGLAMRGQLRGRVSEEELIRLMKGDEDKKEVPRVVVKRAAMMDDDDDEILNRFKNAASEDESE